MKSEPKDNTVKELKVKVLRESDKEIVLEPKEFRKLINKIKELQRANDFLNRQNEALNER